MPQIKLGFNRVPPTSIPSLQLLYDIVQGVPLRDENNNPIVAEASVLLSAGASAANATSVTPSNTKLLALKIKEQFAEVSAVSTSLLGIPRAERQLSLFADVSTYGLNPEEYEFFTFSSTSGPGSWNTRRNSLYGNHYGPRLVEETNEQALVIEAYPVNYTFARGPRYENYNEVSYERFVKFVRLGNQLFEDYKVNYPAFARDRFLNPEDVTVESNEVSYRLNDDLSFAAIETWTLTWIDMRDGNLDDPKDPGKNLEFLTGFGADVTLPGAGAGSSYFGILQTKKFYRYQPGRISGFTFGFKCSTDESSVDNIIEWGIGNPTDQYIFQVRGAALSIVRRSVIPLSNSVITRQGLLAEDQKFVVSAEPINSNKFYELVIPREKFNADTIDGNGASGYLVNPRKVTMYKIEFGWYGAIGARFYAYIPIENDEARWVLLHTLVIENQLGQPCLQDPNFKFKYTLNITDTSNLKSPQFLYKYGASCYIDGGDEDSGSIYNYLSEGNIVNASSYTPLLGILPKEVLSNTVGQEKLNKKNIYLTSLNSSVDQLTELQIVEVEGCPSFGHHYAPSIHATQTGKLRGIEIINNGQSISVVRSEPISVTNISQDSPAVVTVESAHGYFSRQKVVITNAQGMSEINGTEYYLNVLSSTTFSLYTSSSLGQELDTTNFSSYQSDGVATGIPIFLPSDDDAKIINRGLFSSYITFKNELQADIARITGGYIKRQDASLPVEVNSGGVIDVADIDLTNVRFTNFDAMATSSYPLTGEIFDINFLNPIVRDTDGQFAEFLIGITEYKPSVQQVETVAGGFEEVIKFTLKDGITLVDDNLEDLLYEEFTQVGIGRDRDGFETGEVLSSVKMDIDYRLRNPPGDDSGRCSSVRFIIEPRIDFDVTYISTNPDNNNPGNFLTFETAPRLLIGNVNLIGGEFGTGDASASAVSSGIRFISEVIEYTVDAATGQLGYYVEIAEAAEDSNFKIWLSPVTVKDRNNLNSSSQFIKRRIFSFEPKPFYLVVRLRDSARVNNLTVTEYFSGTTTSSCPEWISNDRLNIVSSGNSQPGVPAENFQSNRLLESASVATNLTQPLRPSKVKDTIYVSPGYGTEVPLTSIYGPDRTTISSGLLNTTATFVTARSLENNDINLVNININTKE